MDDALGAFAAFLVFALVFALGLALGGYISDPDVRKIPLQKQTCVEVQDIGGHHNLCPHECFEWNSLKICYEPKAEKEDK